jgi:hypothetical protein
MSPGSSYQENRNAYRNCWKAIALLATITAVGAVYLAGQVKRTCRAPERIEYGMKYATPEERRDVALGCLLGKIDCDETHFAQDHKACQMPLCRQDKNGKNTAQEIFLKFCLLNVLCYPIMT